jgi:hypothetical protein
VPLLAFVIRLYDRVLRGEDRLLPELRRWLDTYGLTPKGRQDRRWSPPAPPAPTSKLDRYLAHAPDDPA